MPKFDDAFLDLLDVMERRIVIARLLHAHNWFLLPTALEDMLFTAQTIVHKYCTDEPDSDY